MIFIYALRKELLEVVRTSKLIIMLAVMVAFGLASPLFARYTPEILSLIPETAILAEIIPEPTLLDAVSQFHGEYLPIWFHPGNPVNHGVVCKRKRPGYSQYDLGKARFSQYIYPGEIPGLGDLIPGLHLYCQPGCLLLQHRLVCPS